MTIDLKAKKKNKIKKTDRKGLYIKVKQDIGPMASI